MATDDRYRPDPEDSGVVRCRGGCDRLCVSPAPATIRRCAGCRNRAERDPSARPRVLSDHTPRDPP